MQSGGLIGVRSRVQHSNPTCGVECCLECTNPHSKNNCGLECRLHSKKFGGLEFGLHSKKIGVPKALQSRHLGHPHVRACLNKIRLQHCLKMSHELLCSLPYHANIIEGVLCYVTSCNTQHVLSLIINVNKVRHWTAIKQDEILYEQGCGWHGGNRILFYGDLSRFLENFWRFPWPSLGLLRDKYSLG